MPIESYALLVSDGSLIVIPSANIKQMRRERAVADTGIEHARHRSKIVRVRVEIIETEPAK